MLIPMLMLTAAILCASDKSSTCGGACGGRESELFFGVLGIHSGWKFYSRTALANIYLCIYSLPGTDQKEAS